MREIEALSGLRGAGAVIVVAHHMCLTFQFATLHGLLLRGYLAVDMFFILSGFVLARRYGDLLRHASPWAVPAFIVRRFARLWPLHVVAMLGMVAVMAALGLPLPWQNQVLTNLAMMQSWDLSQSINVPSWSVSTEWAASLLYPVLAWATLRGHRSRAAAAALAAAAAVVVAAVQARGIPHGRRGMLDIYDGWSALPMLRCIGGFTFGLLILRAGPGATLGRLLRARWTAPACLVLLAAGMTTGVSDLVLYPLLPVLVGSLAAGGGPAGLLLGMAVPRLLGRLSYAIYLVHMPIIVAWRAAAPADSWPLLPLAVAAVATLAYVAVEWPVRAVFVRAAFSARFSAAHP